LLLLAAAAIACGRQEAPEPETRPSVVVITLDTARADALGTYGQQLPTSPRIDRMAAEGVLFEQVVASAPSTFPSHATIFTGQQPYSHGVRSNSGYRLSEANTTLAEVLRQNGYRTGAEIAAPVLKREQRLDQGFDVYRDPRAVQSVLEAAADSLERPSRRNERDAVDVTARGLEFLRENAERPFLLWLHYFDPHHPHQPPPAFRIVFADPYFGEIRHVDAQIGRVLDEIERLGLRSRTLVVLTADHGDGRGEHGEETHSFFIYDSTIRVPLVLWGAGLPRGVRVRSLVRLVDVTPTVLDLLGLPALADVQGQSLRPLLESPAEDLRLTGYGESIEVLTNFGADVLRFVRVGNWKYIHKLEPELFDVGADPGETRNLASQYPERVESLRERLEQLIAAAPPKPDDAEVALDSETLAQLEALGYVGGAAPSELHDELATLELSGPDPVSRTEDIRNLSIAQGELLVGDLVKAELLHGQLLARNPDSVTVLYGLTRALIGLERYSEAAPLLRRMVELEPKSALNRLTLGQTLVQSGELEEAESALRQALVLDDCAVMARLHLSELMRAGDRFAEQRAVLEQGDDACLHSVIVRNALAFALATSPDEDLRDGARALSLAEVIVTETRGEHPDYVDTLAAAYAEAGDFERAVAEQRRAIAMIEGEDLPDDVRRSFERHLAVYEAGGALRGP
jgi:arylsulfatase A-like enzyme